MWQLPFKSDFKICLANKGIELNIVFSLKADALIFYLCILNMLCVGIAKVFSKMFYLLYYNFALPKFPYKMYHEQNNIKTTFK